MPRRPSIPPPLDELINPKWDFDYWVSEQIAMAQTLTYIRIIYDLKGKRIWDMDLSRPRYPKMKARKHLAALDKIRKSPTTPEFLQRAAMTLGNSVIELQAAAHHSPFTNDWMMSLNHDVINTIRTKTL